MTPRGFAAAAAGIAVIAGAARLAGLAARPMHADEAIFAYKLGTLLETGGWSYEPGEYHGPLLHYLTAAVAWVWGIRNHAGLTENVLRVVPAVLGIFTAMTPLLMTRWLGRGAALSASALLAVSPGMVYYSRYYIPEILLIFLTACLVAIVARYMERPGWGTAMVAGVIAGLMFTAKETAGIAVGALVAAGALGWRVKPELKHLAVAAAACAVPIAASIGPGDLVSAMQLYADRGFSGTSHAHPWHYYLGLLASQEWLVFALGIAGVMAGKAPRSVVLFTGFVLVLYSLIPYKTPWCVLTVIYGLSLLAGCGVTAIRSARMPRAARSAAGAALAAAMGVWALQSYRSSYVWAADPGNPYAYAHTSRDVPGMAGRLDELAKVHEAGRSLPVQVISAANVWPLPWYLRGYRNVEWRRAVTAEMRPAPVILTTPDIEPALLHHLYEAMPAGQRPLYLPLQTNYTELRPGVEIRGYVQQSLAVQAP